MRLLRLRTEDIAWREVGGEVLALSLVDSTYLNTNSSGAVLWKALAAGATRDDLISRLVDEYQIEVAQAAVDVEAFLSLLQERGLLET